MATNTANLKLVKPALDDYYDVGVFNKNMDTIDTAIKDLQNNSDTMQAKEVPQGVTDLDQITEAGFYELVSTTTYTNIPSNVSDGMLIVYMHENGIGLQKLISAMGDKTYYRTKPNILANWNQWIEEGSGGGSNPDTSAHIANNDIHVTAVKKQEWDRSFMPRTATPDVTDLNQYTTTGFYQLGAAAGYQNIPQGLDWTILEVKAHTGNYIVQKITSVTTQKSYFRTRTENSDAWSTWKRVIDDADYNTLFQSVSNGKAGLATVIGGVASTASFEELKNKIAQDKQTLIDILVQRGVQVSPDAPLEQIVVSSVNTIQAGKRTSTASVTFNSSTVNTSVSAIIPDLGFTPTIAVLRNLHITQFNNWSGAGTGSGSILTLSTLQYTRLVGQYGTGDITLAIAGNTLTMNTTAWFRMLGVTYDVLFIE